MIHGKVICRTNKKPLERKIRQVSAICLFFRHERVESSSFHRLSLVVHYIFIDIHAVDVPGFRILPDFYIGVRFVKL